MQKINFQISPTEASTESDMFLQQADYVQTRDKAGTAQRIDAPEFYSHTSAAEQL